MTPSSASEERPAELLGQWYPATAETCDDFFASVPTSPTALSALAGALVPHAGWVYSGAVAFRTLRVLAASTAPDLILVFGGHLAPRDPVRVMIEGAWQTPYGPVQVECGVAEDIAMVVEADPETPDHYYEDNAIEVLMPMVAKLWPSIPVVTLGIPPTSTATATGAEAVDRARGRGFERVLVVGSTDLTHYGPNYRFQPKGLGRSALEWVKNTNDAAMIRLVVDLEASAIVPEATRSRNACCPGAVAATLSACRKLGSRSGDLIGYTTSFDAREEREPSSFVGYAGIVLGA